MPECPECVREIPSADIDGRPVDAVSLESGRIRRNV